YLLLALCFQLLLEPILTGDEALNDEAGNIVACGVDHGCGRIHQVVKNILLVILHLRKLPVKTAFRSFDIKLLGQVIKYGFFPMLSGLLLVINFKLDVIFLSAFNIDNFQIGLFSTALAIIEYMALIPGVFNDVLYNHAAKTNPINEIIFSIKTITVVTFVAAIFVAVIAKPALVILYGHEFSGAAPAIWVLLLGRFSLVFFKLIGTLFLSDNKRIQYFLTLLLSFVINAVLNPLLIPIWGICGSAAASVIAEIIASVVFIGLFLKEYNISLKRLLVFEKEEIEKLKVKIKKLISKKQ
ncbi:MAG: polysaccharide biosynthesis C-terminal domain-containing protein, partial [Clostridia bacterium]|nr:polysaccharide biosynthesis C-terminal domain-containing protein [Clostridia bacterium]